MTLRPATVPLCTCMARVGAGGHGQLHGGWSVPLCCRPSSMQGRCSVWSTQAVCAERRRWSWSRWVRWEGGGQGCAGDGCVQSDTCPLPVLSITDNLLPSPFPLPSTLLPPFPSPSLLSVVAQPGPAAGSGPGPYLRGAGGSDPGTEARAAPQECRAPAGQVRGEQAGR